MNTETGAVEEAEGMETKSAHSKFKFYHLDISEYESATLLQAPKTTEMLSESSDVFNLLMADVSGSMSSSWNHVVNGWRDSIQNKLCGVTKLFVFNNNVKFLRDGTELLESDFDSGGTNITLALKKVNQLVNNCKQRFIQVFIITDGGHGCGSPYPEEEIDRMQSPPGKIVNVFLLGISPYFPVNYSIDIRSRLHNGSANLPSLYWANMEDEIQDQMASIGNDLGGHVKMTLSQEGYILPGLPATKAINSCEWMYFPKSVEELMGLKLSINDEEEKELNYSVMKADVALLLDNVFPQWNSVLIQLHRKKLDVPMDTFTLMKTIFDTNMKDWNISSSDKKESIKTRLERKKVHEFEIKFKTLMNLSRSVIEVEGAYRDEIELANKILKSTVSGRKYDTKVLQMRGHGLDDFVKDREDFFEIYKKNMKAIQALDTPQPEDCCRITMSSTLSDLQDEDFLLMEKEGKYELLRSFTMSGIPAYAPISDSSQINSWTLSIRHILVTPYTILSQRAIEAYAGVEDLSNTVGCIDKEVRLQQNDDSTSFNIIIPIIPEYAASVLKSLVNTNLYAMLATFCILKNPHIVDHSAHLAALACAWVRSVSDHPTNSRPEFIVNRLASISATAKLYMGRSGVATYLKALISSPHQALMTESTDTFDKGNSKVTLKCESMVKPLFFLGLSKDKLETSQMITLFHLLLAEFIGRCLSNYKITETDATPFTDFFAPELNDPEKKEEWLVRESQIILSELTSTEKGMLEEFYAPENLQKALKKHINSKISTLSAKLTDTITIAIDMKKVKQLRSLASCGDVRFYTFRAWAEEMGLPKEEISAVYDPKQIFIFVSEALHFRNSRERLGRKPDSYDDCLKKVKDKVCKENGMTLLKLLIKKISEVALAEWRKQYLAVHKPIAMPLLPEQVVSQAQARGIKVTEHNFAEIYKYDTNCKLLRNACQIPACPFYLHPSRKFNQHLAVERAQGSFPHSLHLVSKNMCVEGVEKVIAEVSSGKHSGQKNRKKTEPLSLNNRIIEIEQLVQFYKDMPS